MIKAYTISGLILLVLLPFSIFSGDHYIAAVNGFAVCVNGCLLYLAENQELLKQILSINNEK